MRAKLELAKQIKSCEYVFYFCTSMSSKIFSLKNNIRLLCFSLQILLQLFFFCVSAYNFYSECQTSNYISFIFSKTLLNRNYFWVGQVLFQLPFFELHLNMFIYRSGCNFYLNCCFFLLVIPDAYNHGKSAYIITSSSYSSNFDGSKHRKNIVSGTRMKRKSKRFSGKLFQGARFHHYHYFPCGYRQTFPRNSLAALLFNDIILIQFN